MTPFRLQLARWFQGLLRGSVQGGAIAAKAFIGTNIAAPIIHRPDLAISLQGMLLVFASGALYHLWDYLASNPLPDIPETTISPIPPIPPISAIGDRPSPIPAVAPPIHQSTNPSIQAPPS